MSEFVLQNSRSNTGDRLMFWASNAAGYTTNLDAAQRYTKEQATSQNESRESDLPWPLAYLMDRHTLAVDCQNVKLDEVEAQLPDAGHCYLYADGAWNGNDLYWLTDDGDITDDFSRAHAFPANIAKSMAGREHHKVSLAPVDLIDSLVRKVVSSSKVNHREALRGTGIMLAKPIKYRAQRDRCDHCGVFISDAQRFQDCPKCGGSNAP